MHDVVNHENKLEEAQFRLTTEAFIQFERKERRVSLSSGTPTKNGLGCVTLARNFFRELSHTTCFLLLPASAIRPPGPPSTLIDLAQCVQLWQTAAQRGGDMAKKNPKIISMQQTSFDVQLLVMRPKFVPKVCPQLWQT